MHNAGAGLAPKQLSAFDYTFKIGERGLKFDMGAKVDASKDNAVIRHQLLQAGFPTSGVSTTPHFARASFYALGGGKYPSGFVYELDASKLTAVGIQIFRVSDYAKEPSVPQDDEFILVASPPGSLPQTLVTTVHCVP